MFREKRSKLLNRSPRMRRRLFGYRRFERLVFQLIVLCLFVSQSAGANWRYTTWNMTPDEVVGASSDQATLLNPPIETQSGLLTSAVGRYETGPFVFEVSFLFRAADQVLERVVLHLEDNSSASQLYQSLVATYGDPEISEIKPILVGESHTATWKNSDDNNLIVYFGIGDYYAIEYAPLNRAVF